MLFSLQGISLTLHLLHLPWTCHSSAATLLTTNPRRHPPITAEYHKAMKGRIPELVRHPSAAHVIDELYSASGPPARNAMAAEFYGREYRLFEGGTLNGVAGAPASLARLLAGVDAGKAGAILQHMAAAVLPIVEKKLVDCALVHRVLAEFMALAPASLVADAVGPLSGEALLHMVHTREGAAAACAVLAHGSPKDRKAAVRALKGHVARMALDDWGHLPLITALSVVDDTALLRKFIVTELQVRGGLWMLVCTGRGGSVTGWDLAPLHTPHHKPTHPPACACVR